MPLAPGQRLGPYVIEAPLGAGGMGEVYRARDTRLGRDVALKVVTDEAAGDAERLARFAQEARAAAALNHPNILAVFDVGGATADDGPYIVSELLEGETLGARLARGRLPVRMAIELATQVARALAAAHDKGIVHRDLKPDNIFVTRDGTAKVLDFGLAKLRDSATVVPGEASTVTGRPATAQGAVMGTVGYMAPEQVRGAEADHRADLFALGVTLYEMLSGQRAFAAPSTVEALNAILTSEPVEFAALGVPVPADVTRIVAHCLEKQPADRFQSARDLAFQLAGVAGSSDLGVRRGAPSTTPYEHRWRVPWPMAAGILFAALVAGVLGAVRGFGAGPPAPEVTTFDIVGDLAGGPSVQGMAMSPDGRLLAMTWAGPDGALQLVLRAFDDGERRLVAAAGGPQVPFFSPDGRHLAYFAGVTQQLLRVPVSGGTPEVVTSLSSTRTGGVWLPGDLIVFGSAGAPDLKGVPVRGGPPQVVVPASAFDGESLRFPTATSDGSILVFQVGGRPPFRLGAYSLSTGRTAVLGRGSSPRLAADARLVYALDGELWAAAFDPATLTLAGGQRLGVSAVTNSGGLASFAVAGDTLAAVDGGSNLRQLVIYDRTGRRQVLTDPARRFFNNAVPSPDGTRIATGLNDTSGAKVVLFDLARSGLSTAFEGFPVSHVEWTPGGELLAYELGANALRAVVPGADRVSAALFTGVATNVFTVTAQGEAMFVGGLAGDVAVQRAPLDAPAKAVRLWTPRSPGSVVSLRPSPDGLALASTEYEGSRIEVFVRRLDDTGRRVQVSVEGGDVIGWDAGGSGVYYFSRGAVWFAPIAMRPVLAAGRPQRLYDVSGDVSGMPAAVRLRMMPDGERILALEGPPSQGVRIRVVRHGLQRLLAMATPP